MKVSALRKQSGGLFLAESGEVGTECEALGNRAVKCAAFGRALLFPPFLFNIAFNIYADVAHLVERHLAKVEVAGSSPVIRSKKHHPLFWSGV